MNDYDRGSRTLSFPFKSFLQLCFLSSRSVRWIEMHSYAVRVLEARTSIGIRLCSRILGWKWFSLLLQLWRSKEKNLDGLFEGRLGVRDGRSSIAQGLGIKKQKNWVMSYAVTGSGRSGWSLRLKGFIDYLISMLDEVIRSSSERKCLYLTVADSI